MRRRAREKGDPWGTQSVVYFLQETGEMAIKIGFTSGRKHRVSSIQAGTPRKIVVLAWLPGSREDEAELHRRFSHLNTYQGEWFQPADDLVAFIEEVKRRTHRRRSYSDPQWKTP